MSAQSREFSKNEALSDTIGAVRKKGLPLIAGLFIVSLVVPLFINLGSVRLPIYRIVLLALFVPGLYRLFSGQVGRVRLPDLCVVAICLWSSISFVVNHGLGPMVETIGLVWIDTLGAYLIGRCYIRTPEAFHATVRLLFWLAVILLPFAIYEAMSGEAIIIKLFSEIGATYPDHWMEKRMNLDRVQGPFPHPIHFGVFILSLVGVSYYVLGYNQAWVNRIAKAFIIALTGAFCLSSGPLVSLMAQANIIVWDGLMKSFRQRWHFLLGLSVLGFIIVDLISNRTPFHVLASYLSFNAQTAYSRINIWIWGTKNIFDNPLFGIGFNDWERLYFMTDSVDMFWILPAMQNGIPVWILWFLLFFSIFLSVAYRRNLNEKSNWYRTGYLVTMFGMFMVGWTVHFWTHTYVFFVFMLASGIWFCDHEERSESPEQRAKPSNVNTLLYSRFEPKKARILDRRDG
ncbi:O-antigen ligase family protein [Roseovarius sp. S1116L3]|uniref:O-antigen ligase family protein n=1 Tax=Roseovarius roseus TaxID=3342636 RepID=UPI00372C671D